MVWQRGWRVAVSDEAQVEIRTPDQRLRVFVSSTLAELADERAAVARAISALRLTPVLFELGARPHPPRELYRAYLAQSDIFVGLYWQRYGWIGPGMDISGLEDEFRLSHSIPRLLYVKTPAPEREPRLTAMIEELQSEGTDSYRSFRNPRELGRLVRDDLALLLSERFGTTDGRVDRQASPASSSDRRIPRSLPVTSTSLIGREQDLVAVAELLQSPGVRLVSLTGPGGIGKTRLAIAVGEQLDARYRQGAVFVALEVIAQPELVLPRVAVDDFDGALRAASTALDGFREQNEPFVAFAALTVGMVESALGRSEAARAHLTEVNKLGGQFDNNWLESAARTQLASLAVRAGDFDEARTLLVASVDAEEESELSALTVTFSLVASAGLALAEGDAPRAALALGAADGLRRRAGLRAWPSTRRGEHELASRVAQGLEPHTFEEAFTAGAELSHRQAVALVRGDSRQKGGEGDVFTGG